MTDPKIEDITSIVDGKFTQRGKMEEMISPVTKTTWGNIASATDDEIQKALEVVQKNPKLELPTYLKSKILEEIADHMLSSKENLALCITIEMGKPIADARGEVTYAANYFKWYAEEIKRVYGKVIPSSKKNKKLEVRYEPIGPCAIITPWNFPIAMAARKIAPALAAGCPVIVKPSSFSPASLLILASICLEVGLPDHALQVLIGPGNHVAKALMDSPAIKKFSFTGSTSIGTNLYVQGAKTLKKCTLELGGNAPFIVFDDADIVAAAKGATDAKFRLSGQTCICANRIFVHKDVEAKFIEEFSANVKKLTLGDPRKEETELSNVLHHESLKKSERHVKDALQKGAKALLNRSEPYEAEILTNVTSDMEVFNEETFGPVAPIITFESEEEVTRLANQTPFGLAAYVYTEGHKRAERVTNALEYGVIGLNDPLPSSPESSFGGIKASGFGREGGPSGIYEYLTEKFVSEQLES
ncbi:MAG: NAD-dependent succinate-semialdehyde dehydrogenase [Simkaniaceae bacterium]|nr:NAD-dependent succinate-semialdehyde dehydrogenase [Simkaniaceae bacterium]